jgi:predicted PurR-regulated permease PerM
MEENQKSTSPPWGSNAKFIVSLTIVGVMAFLIIKFQNLLGPLLIAFTVTYLFYPFAKFLHRVLHIPWRLVVSLIYLLVIILLIGLVTLGGLALFDQLQSLVNFLQRTVVSLPDTLSTLSKQTYAIGPYQFQMALVDWGAVSNQIIGAVQPMLGRVTGLLGVVASSAANVFAWTAFVLLISYFTLLETGGSLGRTFSVRLPGYEVDTKRMGNELSRIWNAFLRGQLIITLIAVVVYTFVLGGWGLNFYLGLAVLAGVAKFIPYVGSLILYTTYFLVAVFQPNPPFGLTPAGYGGLVVVSALLVDYIIDNFVSPRIMAQALKVHPAAVLLAALIAVNFFGLIGILLAAPVLATLKLLFNYATRKLFDLDPWEGVQTGSPPEAPSIIRRLRAVLESRFPARAK